VLPDSELNFIEVLGQEGEGKDERRKLILRIV
jgi:hypothetical protein